MKRPDRPRMRRPASAADLVQQLLQQRGMEGKIEEYRAWQVWDQVVGPQIARRARPIRIREGVLEVRVDQPVWMQQLQLLKPRILARLNEALGKELLRDLFLRRGAIDQAPTTAAIEPPPAWLQIRLSAEETNAIEASLATIADPELRASLRAVLLRQKQLAKSRQGS
jgi:hypothetical protein